MPDPALIDAPADMAARDAALDVRDSIIVQAPAGSGKTDLLTRRYLRLLAAVDEPEEVLAITFTRAATAEMRARILRDLEIAAGRRASDPRDDPARIVLARAALAHAGRRNWNLFDHPQRLAIETIDSLCLRIAHDRPLLARLGGRFQPVEEADALYDLAARSTLEGLGGDDPGLNEALGRLLDLRDNSISGCQSLIAEMLKVRDQWQHAFPLSGKMSEDDWADLRGKLATPFFQENRRVLSQAHGLLTQEPALAGQLLDLAQYAAENGNQKVALLVGVDEVRAEMPREHWDCIRELLLTGKEWRRTVNKLQGFPSTTREQKQRRDAMHALLVRLRTIDGLLEALCAIRDLPPAAYTDEQWSTLRSIFTVLRHAVARLDVVFAEHDQVDFAQLNLAALQVLRDTQERIYDIAGNIRHLLIDEFQDTSRRQHDLVTALLKAWEPGEGRTVFLVGDPMQSIYLFRQAEVELFTQVRDRGINSQGGCLRCRPVQLSVNFRSHAALTEPINEIFDVICASDAPPGSASVPFARATSAADPDAPQPAFHIHPQIIGAPDRAPTQAEAEAAQRAEADDVVRILELQLPLIERAQAAGSEYRVAVLVRARAHLAQIVPRLRGRIPFRAVEIEHLSDRQELLDLRALTRALLHPMDRIAWLSVLRAPWCGLILSDLHRLTGSDDPAFRDRPVLDLIGERLPLLSPDGQQRLGRTAQILRRALDLRWRQSESPSFSSWIERTWRTLGGEACLDSAAAENAEVYFSLLDSVAADGLAPSTNAFDAEFDRLFAQPDPAVGERSGIQLMTIHKAKGLGFDVVLVPGLDRRSSSDANSLVCSLERSNPFTGETEFLVAPIGLQGEETEPLYKWVRKQRQIRYDEERKRLLYVACTRARRELHLFGTAAASASGARPQNKESLLNVAWPALWRDFESRLREAPAQVPGIEPEAQPGRVIPFPAPGVRPGVLEEVAAGAEAGSGLILHRLAAAAEPVRAGAENVTVTGSIAIADPEAAEFLRREGSRDSRLIGSIVHELLERLGPGLARLDFAKIRARALALLRASSISGESLKSVTDTVTNMLLQCAADPVCQWILAAHTEAQSEASWTGFLPAAGTSPDTAPGGSRLRTLRADRVFRAGSAPLDNASSDYLWIIDYKTAAIAPGALLLASERALYAPQLQAYARVLRALHGPGTRLRLGLYYAAIATLDYWDPGEA